MSTDALPRPRSILLATDLSARSDRAHARAVQLAQQWQAALLAVVVVPSDASFSRANAYVEDDEDAPPPETPFERIAREAREDLADAGVPVQVRVASGAVGPTVLGLAHEAGAGLIVTGTARADAVQRIDPGSTLNWLARHSDVPVLAVHDRVRGPYAHVAVASDHSQAARCALATADAWFTDARQRSLVHAYDVPLATMSAPAEARAATLGAARENAQRESADYLAGILGEHASRWEVQAQLGNPVRLVREFAHQSQVDLTVMASHGRNRLVDRLIGSVATRLLETVPNDLLVVRTPVP